MRIILIRKHNIDLAQNSILYITYHSMMVLWPHTPQVKWESLSYPCWFGFVFISFVGLVYTSTLRMVLSVQAGRKQEKGLNNCKLSVFLITFVQYIPSACLPLKHTPQILYCPVWSLSVSFSGVTWAFTKIFYTILCPAGCVESLQCHVTGKGEGCQLSQRSVV